MKNNMEVLENLDKRMKFEGNAIYFRNEQKTHKISFIRFLWQKKTKKNKKTKNFLINSNKFTKNICTKCVSKVVSCRLFILAWFLT